MRFGGDGELAALFGGLGLRDVRECTLVCTTTYADVDELWDTFLGGVGAAGAFCVSLPPDRRAALREELHRRLGSPTGRFELRAVARCAVGTVPP